MSEIFNMNLTNEVVNHFENVLANEAIIDESEIINQVTDVITKLKSAHQEDYVVKHIEKLEEMQSMLSDEKWNMSKQDKDYVLAALSYFVDENDIIPDDIPVVGFLDDCIIIDIVTDKIIHELEAFREFKKATKIYGKGDDFSVSDWMDTKRKELFSRMRSRRNKARSSHRTRGTSFTL
jgi:uncharacterized membrane protein YkvA (DUF1232 family)